MAYVVVGFCIVGGGNLLVRKLSRRASRQSPVFLDVGSPGAHLAQRKHKLARGLNLNRGRSQSRQMGDSDSDLYITRRTVWVGVW